MESEKKIEKINNKKKAIKKAEKTITKSKAIKNKATA